MTKSFQSSILTNFIRWLSIRYFLLFFRVSQSSKTVVVAMSGGVDSSVAAAILKEDGYRVIGIMLRLWAETGTSKNRCCTPDSICDAEEIAYMLDIPFYVRNYKELFFDTVVNFFKNSHLREETPNPCLVCNREVRFGSLLKEAKNLGADYLATGHYARVEQNVNREFLLKTGVDARKDQSYMLHRLDQNRLSSALFPIGKYTKDEVRKIAESMNLPVYKKSESQDLCFIGDEKHGDFLKRHTSLKVEPGPIVDLQGKKLGTHIGLVYYTIGQRKGLGIAAPEPLFVKKIDPTNNTLIVAPKQECGQTIFFADCVHEINPGNLCIGKKIPGKVRYKSNLVEMEILEVTNKQMKIESAEPLFGVTPGQAVVFYDGDQCLGGAILRKEISDSARKSA